VAVPFAETYTGDVTIPSWTSANDGSATVNLQLSDPSETFWFHIDGVDD
jgi:hypothetical protein